MVGSVKILIEGRQRPGGEEWMASRSAAEGICRKDEGGYVVVYRERTEAGIVRTELCLGEGQMRILRSGGIGMALELVPGQMRKAPYTTAFGTIPLSVQAAEVVTEFSPDRLSARAAYTLFNGGEPVSENELNIQVMS